jgi:hypothetical protein
MKCYYGCGLDARFKKYKSGKHKTEKWAIWCCSEIPAKCPSQREKAKRNSIETIKKNGHHNKGKRGFWGKCAKLSDDEIFKIYDGICDSPIAYDRALIKYNRSWRLKIPIDICEKCNLDSWFGEKITCDLHHKNSNELDNRLENLIFLCPNCHRIETKKNVQLRSNGI